MSYGDTTAELTDLNNKLSGLYAMVGAIGAQRHLQPILDTVTSEMAKVMEVPAATIKLRSEDGETLRYVASQGLPEDLVSRTVIQLDHEGSICCDHQGLVSNSFCQEFHFSIQL